MRLTPRGKAKKGVIPTVIDQNRCAHWRRPIDMMAHGRFDLPRDFSSNCD
jgi:hypothetical protein